jgi:acyl carrier protein
MVTEPRSGWGNLESRSAGQQISASDRCRPASVADDDETKTHYNLQWVALKDEVGTMSDIADRVKKIVVDNLGVEPDKVTENASFIDDLGADSLDTVELVMAFEEEFNCEIPDDTAETILTVGDAIKFLEKNAKG